MSGDNQYVSQPLKFYTEEMTEKRNAIAYLEKKLIPVANSVIYLDQKRNESRVAEAAQYCKEETSLGNRAISLLLFFFIISPFSSLP